MREEGFAFLQWVLLACVVIAVLAGTAGLGIFLLRSRLCLELHAVTLWSTLAGLACFLGLFALEGEGERVLILGLPFLAVGAGLVANTVWGKGKLKTLPGDLGEEGHQRAVERLGRRIWFPLMSVVGVASGYLVCLAVFVALDS